MKVIIKSRAGLERLAEKDFEQNTAIISIVDYNALPVFLKKEPRHLMRLSFNDLESDVFIDELGRKPTDEERIKIENKYHMLTDKQAESIADFYLYIEKECDYLICQCEHGQSRSAAVAGAIMEFRARRGIEIFANDKYYPNKVVFRKVLTALNKKAQRKN